MGRTGFVGPGIEIPKDSAPQRGVEPKREDCHGNISKLFLSF